MPGDWDVVSVAPARRAPPADPWAVVSTTPAGPSQDFSTGRARAPTGRAGRTRPVLTGAEARGRAGTTAGDMARAGGNSFLQSLEPAAGAASLAPVIRGDTPDPFAYTPRTGAGHVAGVIGGNLINALVPGTGATRVANVLAPAGGSLAGEQVDRSLGGTGEVGAVVGGLLGGVGAGLRPRLSRAPRPIAPAPAPPEVAVTARTLVRQGGPGAADPAAMRLRADEFRAAGIEPTIVDTTTESGRGLIKAAASRPTGARTTARQFNTDRMEALPGRVGQQLRTHVSGDRRTVAQLTDAIEAARQTTARTDYAPAYAHPVPVTPDILSALSGPEGRTAIGRALKAASARRDSVMMDELSRLRQAAARPNLAAAIPTISAGALDRIQIAFGRNARTFARNDATDIASGIYGRQSDINTALDNVPEIAPAREHFRDYSGRLDAVDVGSDFMRGNPDEQAAAYSGMNPAQLDVARATAARAAEIEAGRGPRNALQVADRLGSGAPNIVQVNNALLTPPTAARLGNAMRLETRAVRNAQAVNPYAGSPTHLNFTGQEQLDAAGNLVGAAGDVGDALIAGSSGRPLAATGAAIRALRRIGIHRGQIADADVERLVAAAMDPARHDAIVAEIDRLAGRRGAGIRFLRAAVPRLAQRSIVPLLSGATAATQQQQP